MTHSGSPSLHAILKESPSEDDLASSEGESSGSPVPRACNTVISAIPIATMLPPEETPMPQTIPMMPQWTATPIPLPSQLMAYQEERRCALHDDIERKAMQQQGKPSYEWATIEARLIVGCRLWSSTTRTPNSQKSKLLGQGLALLLDLDPSPINISCPINQVWKLRLGRISGLAHNRKLTFEKADLQSHPASFPASRSPQDGTLRATFSTRVVQTSAITTVACARVTSS
jgi:hypothetical protein